MTFRLPELTYPLSINTLGKKMADGQEITIHCHTYGCNHRARINLVMLARKLGMDHGAMDAELRPYFYCQRCRDAGRPDRNFSFCGMCGQARHRHGLARKTTSSKFHRSFTPLWGAASWNCRWPSTISLSLLSCCSSPKRRNKTRNAVRDLYGKTLQFRGLFRHPTACCYIRNKTGPAGRLGNAGFAGAPDRI